MNAHSFMNRVDEIVAAITDELPPVTTAVDVQVWFKKALAGIRDERFAERDPTNAEIVTLVKRIKAER